MGLFCIAQGQKNMLTFSNTNMIHTGITNPDDNDEMKSTMKRCFIDILSASTMWLVLASLVLLPTVPTFTDVVPWYINTIFASQSQFSFFTHLHFYILLTTVSSIALAD
jgi:hypothetical protein